MQHMQSFHCFCRTCGVVKPTPRMALEHKQRRHGLNVQEQAELLNLGGTHEDDMVGVLSLLQGQARK